MAAPLDAAGFAALLPVSRETLERLARYLDLLHQWRTAINLVGRSTLADPWRRHLLDCAQLHAHLPPGCCSLADLGSGAGLPGLVLAIMGVPEVHLIESDRRKAAFLQEVVRTLRLSGVSVHARRVESVALRVDAVTARALAPLDRLIALARPLLVASGRMIFCKGRNVEAELTALPDGSMMRLTILPSLSDRDGRIVLVDPPEPIEAKR